MVKKVLVTGGAGFIGSHLCEALSTRSGYEVYSLDNYFTGSSGKHIKGVTYLEGDTVDIAHHIDFTPDFIYHLGEYSRVEQSFEDIEQVLRANKMGTYAVLEFCRKRGSKLIYGGSSTKFVEGGQGRHLSPYTWSKISNTELIANYGLWYGMRYVIAYFYNVYGGRDIAEGKYATLIAIFKARMLKGEKLMVTSPGTQKRNFTHIDDIIRGLILVGEEGEGDDYGLGHDQGYSILEIAQMFGGEIELIPERRGNRMDAEVMSQKPKELGWRAVCSVEDHIKDFKKEYGV